jgi:hypothetical protein
LKRIINRFFNLTILSFINSIFPLKISSYKKPGPLILNGRTLVVAPHFDDELIGCFSILKNHDNVTVLILTTSLSDQDELRYEESYKLSLKHKYLLRHIKLIKDGSGKFVSKKFSFPLKDYENIFIPSLYDRHPDHFLISMFFLKKLIFTSKSVYLYEVWSSLPYFSHYSFINGEKLDDLNIFKSQVSTYSYSSLVENRAKYRGVECDHEMCEAFLKII